MARANGVKLAFIVALYICATLGAEGAIFEIQNKCPYTVWAAGLPGGGTRLESGQLWTLPVANDTERGRLWGRTGCFFDRSGQGGCNTGNCGSPLYCQEPASPPVTVVEYSLNQSNNLDFYDISLVEGFNLPMSIIPSNSSCQAIACSSDINAVCPAELKVVNGCYSACTTFNTPQYCCTGEYSNNCSPTNYSKFFKDQCPQAYSYAMDNATSTFSCSGGNNYKVVFCGGNVTPLQAPPGSTNSAVTPLSGNSTPPSGVELPDNCKKPSKIVPILVGSVVGTALFVILCLVFGRCVRHRKSSVRTDNNLDARENFGQVSFDYKVLRDSTENFDRKNMLGKGGFGEVYKGILPDGRVLAVKKLNGRQTTQAAEEFLREVRLILSVRHRNLVRLLGCCKRGHKRLLVYEFMSNSSLDKHLFGEIRNALSWENRLNIIVGTAPLHICTGNPTFALYTETSNAQIYFSMTNFIPKLQILDWLDFFQKAKHMFLPESEEQ